MEGNVQKMREALEAARDLLLPQCNGGTAFAKACGETVNKIMDALSALPRNCNIGTPEERMCRYNRLREEINERYKRLGEIPPPFAFPTAFEWEDRPYEEGGEK